MAGNVPTLAHRNIDGFLFRPTNSLAHHVVIGGYEWLISLFLAHVTRSHTRLFTSSSL